MESNNQMCKTCGATLSEDDVNQEQQYTKCSRCGSIFGPDAWKAVSASSAETPFPQPASSLPPGIALTTDLTGLSIAYRKSRDEGLKKLAVTFIFGAVLLWQVDDFAGIPLLQQIFYGAIGIFMVAGIYAALCDLLNTITTRATLGRLQVYHAPLPFIGNQDISADMLEQLYVKQHITPSRRGGRTVMYTLTARLSNGKDLALFPHLPTPGAALYIEQELEHYLDIEDRRVADDYKPQ